ncbi:CoA pyrophosphatase [Tissierella sp. Yu-01]|jgi:8-oxo-dGTP pyrophosphatase MutT (NUDIX family)|uniref:NUDIX hydrolase n=1 Tax=Tissierella sp. Yu-01 TaxID=3035694 RepID=UPI00240E3B7F|nr:CoA pyrophosphatase [Tissierella sp. Yu-01]WFA07852.1 CoA pyrophosphatase [Tissierella sp. Yu-01]
MNIDKLIKNVSERIPKPMDVEKKYSVLIPLIKNNGRWEVIYELRSKSLKSQPGEISFPGGKVEEDETFKDTAIRETVEELLIKTDNIKVVGELDYIVSYANFTIHCFLGIISGVNVDNIKPNEDEVDHLFTVPLEFFMENEPDKYVLDLQTVGNDEFPYSLIPNGRQYNFKRGKHHVLFYKYEDYIIWGFTAKMTKHLVDIILSLDEHTKRYTQN